MWRSSESMLLSLLVLSGIFGSSTAFVVVGPQGAQRQKDEPSSTIARTTRTTSTSIGMLSDIVSSSSSMIISTIDSDIANIPVNEFAPVFAGGLMIMFGGYFSALAVGTVVEQKDLYAPIIVESNIGNYKEDDFWENLEEEDILQSKKFIDEQRQLYRDQNDGKDPPPDAFVDAIYNSLLKSGKFKSDGTVDETKTMEQTNVDAVLAQELQQDKTTTTTTTTAAGGKEQDKDDMFSDY